MKQQKALFPRIPSENSSEEIQMMVVGIIKANPEKSFSWMMEKFSEHYSPYNCYKMDCAILRLWVIGRLVIKSNGVLEIL